MALQLPDDLFVEITCFDQFPDCLFSLIDPRNISIGSSHRPAFPATIRVWPARGVARKAMHPNSAVDTERMLLLRVFNHSGALTTIERQLDASGDATA
jgi:hypothetical protein